MTSWLGRSGAAILAVLSLLGGACGPVDDEAVETRTGAMLSVENGLFAENGFNTNNIITAQNGIGVQNGIGIQNGVTAAVGLGTVGGISGTTGFMTTPEGRTFVSYLVRCALPKSVTLTVPTPTGFALMSGELGLAPQWQLNACDSNCQEVITSCLLALTNRDHRHVTVELVSSAQTLFAVGPVHDGNNYPNQEGAVFGNMFTSPPQLFSCVGSDSNRAEQVKRHCIDNVGCNLFTKMGSCPLVCSMANCTTGADGKARCSASSCRGGTRMWSSPLTIYLPNKMSTVNNDGFSGARLGDNGLYFDDALAIAGRVSFNEVQFGAPTTTTTKFLEVTTISPQGGVINVSSPNPSNGVPLALVSVNVPASTTLVTSRAAFQVAADIGSYRTLTLELMGKGASFGLLKSVELK